MSQLQRRPRILYLEPEKGVASGFRSMLSDLAKRNGNFSAGDCFFLNLNKLVPNTMVDKKVGKKTKRVPNRAAEITLQLRTTLSDSIRRINPTQIIINCPAALFAITGTQSSLSNNRGSVYLFGGLYCFVLDELLRTQDKTYGKFVLANDLKKIGRFIYGQQRAEPRFVYEVCRTLDDCRRARDALLRSSLIAADIETNGQTITSIQFASLETATESHPDSEAGVHGTFVRAWVFPFYDERKPGGAYWDTEQSEAAVWTIVRSICDSDVAKCGHNFASYDSQYFIRYWTPVTNFLFDTLNMWHSLYAQLPKTLDFVTSICVDHYSFWKEDSKGVEEEEITNEGMERFWRYGALDVYYTLLTCMYLCSILARVEYARVNYLREFPRQVGPCLAMSTRGIRVDRNYLQMLRQEWEEKHRKNEEFLRIATDSADFNPNSPDQVASLIYDVLGAKAVRSKGGPRSTNEIALKLISDQHPLYKKFCDAILEYKETATIKSRYLYMKIRRWRFHYSMNAAGTYTERLSSGPCMWEGQNAQNIPDMLRGFLVVDEGYIIFDVDLEQSDARFVAYESEDERFINTVESGKDTHCVHAAHFFKESYELIFDAVAAGIAKYAHKVTGIRAITKRIVHGANYQMAAYTLYTTMGRDAVVAAAIAIGAHDAATYSVKQLTNICELFLEAYHQMYTGLRPWYKRLEAKLKLDKMIRTCYGWTVVFFGDPNDGKTQRDATALCGQGGTAGCINRALDYAYWGNSSDGAELLDGNNLWLLLQVHDSIVGRVSADEQGISQLLRLIDYMQWPTEINGRVMHVPAAPQIGVRWGKHVKKVSIEQLKNGEWQSVMKKALQDEFETQEKLRKSVLDTVKELA